MIIKVWMTRGEDSEGHISYLTNLNTRLKTGEGKIFSFNF
jgi:hypothetical protein